MRLRFIHLQAFHEAGSKLILQRPRAHLLYPAGREVAQLKRAV